MKHFLHKFVCITCMSDNEYPMYFTKAYVTEVTNLHISFLDFNKNQEPHTYMIERVHEIKLSTKATPEDYAVAKQKDL